MRELLVDQRIAAVAGAQHGVVTSDQLTACGLSSSAISRRVALGRLHRIHRGVYAVGHAAISRAAKWKAATLSCGEEGILSHRSAAELWRMLDLVGGPIHVAIRKPGGRAVRDGVVLHRFPSLQSHDVTSLHNIPVTRPQRTLLDLRATIDAGELRKAVRQAEFLELPIDAAAVISDRAASELEIRFLALCRRHRLPQPETNVMISGIRVDFLWPSQRLIVETDGYQSHRGLVAFQDDRARDARLRTLGYEVIRLTWRQVVDERAATARLLRARLQARSTRTSR